MKYFPFLFFTWLFSLLTQPSSGQSLPTYYYDLNIDNGMPDNHIYQMITDRFGYLWIGTPKGVVRYNGYDYKTFTLADGLPNEDVWNLFEDSRGKIWLGCIAADFGYIHNNRYYKTFLKNIDRSFYPADIRRLKKGGMYFVSGLVNGSFGVYIERNDTLFSCGYRPGTGVDLKTFETEKKTAVAMPSGYLAVVGPNNLYEGVLPDVPGDTLITLNFIAKIPQVVIDWSGADHAQLTGDYQLYKLENRDRIGAFNMRTASYSEIDINKYAPGEKIHHLYPDTYNKFFYAICDRTIVKFDIALNFAHKYAISDLVNTNDDVAEGAKVRTVLQNSFWKNCIGTITNGVFVNNEVANHFRKLPFDLKHYKYIGRVNDSISMWWNSPKKTLARVIGTNKIVQAHLNTNVDRFYKAITSKDGSILITGSEMYSFDSKKGTITRKTPFSMLMYDFAEVDTNTFLLVGNVGLMRWRSKPLQIAAHNQEKIDDDRYDQIIKDSSTGDYWAYNKGKIFVYRHNGSHQVISRDSLKRFGIQRVEKIAIDNTFGNIFLLDHNNLSLYSREKKAFRELFDDYNLEDVIIDVYNDKLIVAGRFGVLFSRITGKNTITQPVLYSNLRDISYRQVTDIFPYSNKLLLQTDKGLYEMQMPTDSMLSGATSIKNDQYRFILNYRDTVKSIRDDDTVFISQLEKKLQFDIINPNGNGKVRYLYRITGSRAWHALNANEISLPSWFEPDKYYDLYLVAQDNVWKSSPLKLKVYIRPYWWQTTLGRRSILAATVLSILILLSASILITRRLVLRAAQKRHLRMELELKAIYSQINPHFIFNTLNSALLLVSKNKMEDAYTHISKFSRLLRSYIKSSRNKYISIADEINNLEDYIELQQTRFKNKFTYEITAAPSINTMSVQIPALLLQPFVENAINHGILPKEQPGHLKIEFQDNKEKDEIICIVEDDGVGRTHGIKQASAEKLQNSRESYGDLLIKDLVSIFNRYEHMNIAIRYIDKTEPLTGTIVYIQIRDPRHGK